MANDVSPTRMATGSPGPAGSAPVAEAGPGAAEFQAGHRIHE
jgi:hypothetical protein